jgi:hypothetical protein
MISAFAQAGIAFSEPRYVAAAVAAADFILEKMTAPDGSLYRTCAVGSPARISGYLEDYACLSNAFVDLFQATFDNRWLAQGVRLAMEMLKRFADANGGFFSTSADHQHLIARGKDRYDGSTPSGNSMAVTALVRLAKWTGRDDLRQAADKTLSAFSAFLRDAPGGSAQMLCALDFHLGPVTEFVVMGAANAPATQEVLALLRQDHRPNAIVLFHDPANGEPDLELLPLLRGKENVADVTTFICTNETCLEPLRGVEAVANWLQRETEEFNHE